MNEELTITKEEDNGSVRFILNGRVNTTTANILQFKLDGAVDKGHKLIIANMANVKFLSSSGIRVLLAAYKKAAKQGSRFRIEYPSENVRNVLGMTALDELLLK